MYHPSTRRRLQLQDHGPLAGSFVAKFAMMLSSTRRTSKALPRRQHSALILEPETDSRGVQRAAFNVHTVVHIWNIITGYPSIMEMTSLWDIHI